MKKECLDIIDLFLYTHDMITGAKAGEYSAIHQYDGYIEQLIESERKETPLETRLRDVLHHIVNEEHEHIKELDKFLAEDILRAALEAFADCECAAREKPYVTTKLAPKIKITGIEYGKALETLIKHPRK